MGIISFVLGRIGALCSLFTRLLFNDRGNNDSGDDF